MANSKVNNQTLEQKSLLRFSLVISVKSSAHNRNYTNNSRIEKKQNSAIIPTFRQSMNGNLF